MKIFKENIIEKIPNLFLRHLAKIGRYEEFIKLLDLGLLGEDYNHIERNIIGMNFKSIYLEKDILYIKDVLDKEDSLFKKEIKTNMYKHLTEYMLKNYILLSEEEVFQMNRYLDENIKIREKIQLTRFKSGIGNYGLELSEKIINNVYNIAIREKDLSVSNLNKNIDLLIGDMGKEKINYYRYFGILNLGLHEEGEIKIDDNFSLRSIEDYPINRDLISLRMRDGTKHQNYGIIIEYKGKAKIKYPEKVYFIEDEKIELKFKVLLLSIHIVKKEIRHFGIENMGEYATFPIYEKFREEDFFLKQEAGIIAKIIKKDDVGEILDIYKDIVKVIDSPNMNATLNNIIESIIKNKDINDRIQNALFSLEGFFNTKEESSKSFVKSISKYLGESEEYFYNIYDVRSKVAHGTNLNLSKIVNVNTKEEFLDELIRIELKLLLKIIKDEELIKLKPSKRIKSILSS